MVLPLVVWAETVNEGTSIIMTIEILSEDDKTVQIGNGKVAAIPVDTSGELVIPSTVSRDDMTYKVVSIADSAFYDCASITSVTFPESITTIGNAAFKGCSSLIQITSNNLTPATLGTESFASISADCKLYIPVGTMPKYHSTGWTKDLFGGGIAEVGDVEENFCLENGVTSDFINNVTYPDDDYSYTMITNYINKTTSYIKGWPMPVRIEVPVTSEGDSLILETYSKGLMARSDTFLVGQRALEIWNLIPQTSYTYKLFVLNSDKTKEEIVGGSFETTGQVRMMRIDNVANFRDIGGWKLPNGQYVKYDKIFRSSELATTSQLITDDGINELLNVQKIQVEIDFGDYDNSPIEEHVDFYRGHDYQIRSCTGLTTRGTQYKNCFEKTVDSLREGKKVLFHCTAGADRSGTFAFLLEGLLGVSESDLAKDYELTSFWYNKRYRYGNGNNLGQQDINYRGLVEYIKNTFEGNTLNEKIEQMALSFGISQKDIDDFRGLMSERNTLSSTDVSIAKGETAQMSVSMNNMDDITAFQFYVKVPEGISLTDAVLSERKSSSHTVQYSEQSDGIYIIVGESSNYELFSGNDGKLVNLELSANNDMNLGDYDVIIKDIVLTSSTGMEYYPTNVNAIIIVLDYIDGVKGGDANCDGNIDATDIADIVNYMTGKPTSTGKFKEETADVNGDGMVNAADIAKIVRIMMIK